MPALELVTDLTPAGDQPEAIAALGRGDRAGRPLPDPARDHRVGEELHDRRGDREGAAADARARAQQDARRAARQRVPGAVPEEPGRVLRLLLRLLPARGVPPDDRHLHREGLVDQRRDRPPPPLGHQRADVAARRDHRGVGVGDLRPRWSRGVRAAVPHPRRRGGARAARRSSPGSSSCSTSATTTTSPATSSACGATPSRCSRRTRSGASGSRSSATRSSASPRSIRSPARSSRSSSGWCCSRRRTTSPPTST